MYDIQKIRADFPILSREVNGKPLVYLDNGASAQKPRVVIDAMTQMYEHDYANVHRGLHTLSTIATEKYEGVRGIVALGGRESRHGFGAEDLALVALHEIKNREERLAGPAVLVVGLRAVLVPRTGQHLGVVVGLGVVGGVVALG